MGDRTPEAVVADIAKLRPRIRRAKKNLDALYALQNDLYVEGARVGAKLAHMAAAGGPALAVGDQAVRDTLRRWEREHPGEELAPGREA